MKRELCYSLLETVFWFLIALGPCMFHFSCLSSITAYQSPPCLLAQIMYHHLSVFQMGHNVSLISELFHIPFPLECIPHPTSYLASTVKHTQHISQDIYLSLNFIIPQLCMAFITLNAFYTKTLKLREV